MKKHTEKLPIDDLFARKLGNMSLPPSPDGFERLQARMGQTKQETKVVFWRNPAVYGYMAAAACLLLVCLFGWLYWPSGGQTATGETQVAVNRPATSPGLKASQQKANQKALPPDIPTSSLPSRVSEPEPEQLAEVQKLSTVSKGKSHLLNKSVESNKSAIDKPVSVANEPVLAQTKPAETNSKVEAGAPTVIIANPSVSDRPTVATTKQAPEAERVLVVTIAEPEALVAARQAVKTSVDEKQQVAINNKPEKEAKESLWQQVKQFKQGEVFARGGESDSERGLLGRAYSGLKQSFGKDKSAKQ